jgi:predicted PhzF superfamily epimerase YddE/YHI9
MERLEPARNSVVFHTKSGPLAVSRTNRGYLMDFPARPSRRIAVLPELVHALGVTPIEVMENQFNYIAVMESAEIVRALSPDLIALAKADRSGVIVTARGDAPYDFTSRYFAPAKGIPEDPVTGAAHCSLAPYWAQNLGKTEFRAYQASKRGGEMICRVKGDRVELEGACVFYMEGEATLTDVAGT